MLSIGFLAFGSAVCGPALAQGDPAPAGEAVRPAGPGRALSARALPVFVPLEPLSQNEIAGFAKASRSDGCGGWAFAAAGLDDTGAGPALIAFPAGVGGVAKIGGRLCTVASSNHSVAGRSEYDRVRGSGFSLSSIPGKTDSAFPVTPAEGGDGTPPFTQRYLTSRAVAGRVLAKRTTCTIGGGACRRYQAVHRSAWGPHEAGEPRRFAQM